MKRVVVTGIGAVTPLGNNFSCSWQNIKAGTSGITPLKINKEGLAQPGKWRSAGQVTDFKAESYLSPKELNHVDPFASFALAAATEALNCSGIGKEAISEAGIIVGSSRGGITTMEKAFNRLALSDIAEAPKRRVRLSSHMMAVSTISAAPALICQKLGMKGYSLGISNACTSGTNAIGEAYRMIKHGLARILLAGGTEAPLTRLCIEGYGSAGALSAAEASIASRPFDINRDGFVLAEGSCILVLEEAAHAIARGAVIYGEIAGYGNVCDPEHLTLPSVNGEVMAMKAALADAELQTTEIDYINAHGTSTPAGDRTEAFAVRQLFGASAPLISSAKSMTGHMLAASGAFETACTLMSIREKLIPPTINTTKVDPECEVELITSPTSAAINAAITNSFGFGGVNAVLVLKDYQ